MTIDEFNNTEESSRHNRFFELFLSSQDRIYGFLYVLLHNRNDAEDILQETISSMWEHFDKYQDGTDFSAWGIAIARNKAINFIKKNARSRPQLSDDVYTKIMEIEAKEKKDISEHIDALKKCCDKLKRIDRKILSLRYKKDVSMKKIAQVLGRSTTGIYHTMARIHSILQECVNRTLCGKQG
jgi:RNA polymerase sigma-70 factor (ECF subfamily)